MAVALFSSPLGREYHGNSKMEGMKLTGRRRVFVQTESGCVLGMELDRSDNAHTVKRRLQVALSLPIEESSLTFGDMVLNNDLSAIRNDSPLLLTRNILHRSSSTPCLSPTGRDLHQKDQSGPVEIIGGRSSNFARTKPLVDEVVTAIKTGVDPVPVNGGLGGAYYFKNCRGESVAIVKPTDEEPFAPNNPKGFVGKALGQPGLKRSVRVGETGFREVAAYLLDYDHFANVPPTALVKITHSIFNINDSVSNNNNNNKKKNPEREKKSFSKIASFQQFIPHDFDASDHGTSSFPVSTVHRIGILDIRIFNTDRHAGNLLVRKINKNTNDVGEKRFGEVELIPIDHGLCLPENLEDPYFEWIHWPQASIPFSEDELEYIDKLDPVRDSDMLRTELPMIREACLRVLVLCTMFLKEAAGYGLCLGEIGEMMSREFRRGEEEPSELEVVCMDARRLVAERETNILSENETENESENSEYDGFQFEIDYNDSALDFTPKISDTFINNNLYGFGKNPFSKLEELIEEDEEDDESESVSKLSVSLKKNCSLGDRSSGSKLKKKTKNVGVNSSAGHRSANEVVPAGASFVKLADMNEEEWSLFLEKFRDLIYAAFGKRKSASMRQRQRLGTSCHVSSFPRSNGPFTFIFGQLPHDINSSRPSFYTVESFIYVPEARETQVLFAAVVHPHFGCFHLSLCYLDSKRLMCFVPSLHSNSAFVFTVVAVFFPNNELVSVGANFVKLADMNEDEWSMFDLLFTAFVKLKTQISSNEEEDDDEQCDTESEHEEDETMSLLFDPSLKRKRNPKSFRARKRSTNRAGRRVLSFLSLQNNPSGAVFSPVDSAIRVLILSLLPFVIFLKGSMAFGKQIDLNRPVQTQMAVALFSSPLGREYHGNSKMEGMKLTGRRRVFVQTESGCVLGMELDRSDNAHTVKRRLQIALSLPIEESSLTFGDMVLNNDLSAIRNDSPLLLTRNILHRSSSTPCLSPTGRDHRQKDQSGPVEILGGRSSNFARTKPLVDEVVTAIKSGVDPVPVNGGLGGAYYFKNCRGESVAIVKPTDEEPFAPNNPKGFVGKALGQPGLKRSVRVGETGFREVAAYLLDYDHFANVPPTALVKITHSIFNINDSVSNNNNNKKKNPEREKKSFSKIASFQQFIPHDFDASDHGTSSFPVSTVHRIGILDIRIFNTDRHAGNLLVRKINKNSNDVGEKRFSEVELIPIDHGLCLPENLEDPYFEWIHWPQASIPFSEDELEYIEKLDPVRDSDMLRTELPMIREACLRVLVLCTVFLKEAAGYGLCLGEIGEMMSREFRRGEEEPSELEVVCMDARRLVAERETNILSENETENENENSEYDGFQFEIDYNDSAVDFTPKISDTFINNNLYGFGKNPFSKLEELIEEDEEDDESESVSKLSVSLKKNCSLGDRSSGSKLKKKTKNVGVNSSAGHRSANEVVPAGASFVKLADMNEEEWSLFLEKFRELIYAAFGKRKSASMRQRQRLGTSCQRVSIELQSVQSVQSRFNLFTASIGSYFLGMDKFITKRKASDSSKSFNVEFSKQSRAEINLPNDLPSDPGMRTRILDYDPNVRDEVRRAYLLKGPCQPKSHNFPCTLFGQKPRKFNDAWFREYSTWLEYSVTQDAAYCLCCYLFKPNVGAQGGGETFVGVGFKNWAHKDKLKQHVGRVNSVHNQAWSKCTDLLNNKQRVDVAIAKHSTQSRIDYDERLVATIDCIRFLLRQGLAFRGNNENETSINRGNFIELLQFLADHNESIEAVTLKNAPLNLKLTSPDIQKDIVHAAAIETTKLIINDIGESFFSILIDESRDISIKEQMSVVLRYVDMEGRVIERFLGIEHVPDTTATTLKVTLVNLFSRHGLSISNLRGQGYDGASNMKGELGGLKTLILNENASAYYVHCFAHQLQLTLVAVAKNNTRIVSLFLLLTNVVNVVGGSCKRLDRLREQQASKVIEALGLGEITSGRGLNQETSLIKPGDTRWGSHYGTLISMITLFPSVLDVLEIIAEDGATPEQRCEADMLSNSLQSFDFIFCLHFMKKLLGITNDLSQALQRKDQDIVNAMNLVRICKVQLQMLRDSGWDSMLTQTALFCEKHEIEVCNMDEMFLLPGRSRRKFPKMTNLHHYRVELFYDVIDLQRTELESRFSETGTKLLLFMACLNPNNSFAAFDKNKLIQLARLYPHDFSDIDVETLEILISTVERSFSAMKIVKNRMRNKMGDQWMNDNLVVYIEKEVFADVGNQDIINMFEKMSTRRRP
ncbi:hypothetical protein LXL04_011141 [Taraxacum kok-saghyz]